MKENLAICRHSKKKSDTSYLNINFSIFYCKLNHTGNEDVLVLCCKYKLG